MDFTRLTSAERDAWVEQRFGLDRRALDAYSRDHRAVVIVSQTRLPPKLVILREGDVLKLPHTKLAVYSRASGWAE